MSTKGKIFTVNTTGTDFTVKVRGKKRWYEYTSYAGGTKETGKHKIANASPYPFKKTKRDGIILNKETKEEIWKGNFKYIVPGFDTISCAGVIIADNPTGGKYLIEIINFENIIKFLLKYFGIGFDELMEEVVENIQDLKIQTKHSDKNSSEISSLEYQNYGAKCELNVKFSGSINEHINDLKSIVETNNGDFRGDYNSGKASGNYPFEYNLEYSVDTNKSEINIKILKKPFFLSCERIKNGLEDYFKNI